METEEKDGRGGRRRGKNHELQSVIAHKLIPVIEQKLKGIGMAENKFFEMIGANPTTGSHMRQGYLCKAENLVVICLALGINMNEFFAGIIPGLNNFLVVYEKKIEEIRRHEALAERARLEMNTLLKGRRPAVSGK